MKLKILILSIGLLLSSCNLSVSPDGTRDWSFSGEVAKAIIVYAAK